MHRKIQGTSLIELILAITIGLILLGIFTKLLIIVHHQALQQKTRLFLYNEAASAAHLLAQDFNQLHNPACLKNNIIIHDPEHLALTANGIKIIASNDPDLKNLLSQSIIKKLLIPSQIIIIEKNNAGAIHVDPVNATQLSSHEKLSIDNNDIVLIQNCQQVWLTKAVAAASRHGTQIQLPFAINIPPLPPLSVTTRQQILWFIMKNNQGHYGLYRLQKPQQTAPVEIASYINNLSIKILLQQNIKFSFWQAVSNTAAIWPQIAAIRFNFQFSMHQQTINWPLIINLD